MPITAGTKLGVYEVLSPIGVGGMGEVYRARDTRLKRDVAVKVLPDEFARDVDHVSRFNREAEVLASLNHPNLAAIYSLGDYEGRPFIVMELLEGHTLKSKIETQRVSTTEIVNLAIQIADALDTAHSRGVVHRDIKPANIHVTANGQAKILDFGIAKLVRQDNSNAPTLGREDQMTSPGVTMGTVSYMSPEQVRGEDLDARTDLFSFGLVLYEMATGRQAFSGATSGVIVEAILNRAPAPPLQLNPTLSAELQRIITKLLEKDRRLRYQSAADLRSDLQRLNRELESGRHAAQPAAEKKSIVVLPFADISAGRSPVTTLVDIMQRVFSRAPRRAMQRSKTRC